MKSLTAVHKKSPDYPVTGAKIRDLTHSLLIRAAGVKVLLQQIR